MTTSQLDIVNIDKSFIQMRLTMNVQLQTSTTSAYDYDVVNSNYYYVFVGLKSGTQVFDQYTIFCNWNVTGCDQNRVIYENFVSMTQKPYDETKSRRNMYTTFENAWNYSKDVCWYYVDLNKDYPLINKKPSYNLERAYFKRKCDTYKNQDQQDKQPTLNNVIVNDFVISNHYLNNVNVIIVLNTLIK